MPLPQAIQCVWCVPTPYLPHISPSFLFCTVCLLSPQSPATFAVLGEQLYRVRTGINNSPCNTEPVSQSRLAVWDIPGAKPLNEPVLSMKWILQSKSFSSLLAGDRAAPPSSLLYEVPERENSLREWQYFLSVWYSMGI